CLASRTILAKTPCLNPQPILGASVLSVADNLGEDTMSKPPTYSWSVSAWRRGHSWRRHRV
ncbi:hypothetical protein, partial [Vibrio owensii]|uniref:hypothetical protein n=1 Tax=Vibrio owensii TaxID=696485 RepID=UPI0040695D02